MYLNPYKGKALLYLLARSVGLLNLTDTPSITKFPAVLVESKDKYN